MPAVRSETVIESPATWKQFEVQLVDLQKAMLYMLTQEVPRNSVIHGSELSALRNWIRVLKRYAPGTVPTRRLFYRLDEWLSKRAFNTSISANDWLSAVENFQGELGRPLPPNEK